MQKTLKETGIKVAGAAFLVSVLGCLAGNALIGAAHGIILVSIVLFLIGCVREKEKGALTFRGLNPSWYALAIVTLSYLFSILVNWEECVDHWKDLKKLRYEVLVLLVLAIPLFRNRLSSSLRLQRWGVRLIFGSAILVGVAGLIGLKTGFNPLLLGALKHETRVSGVSGSVMTYANTMQLVVLLGLSFLILFCRGDAWTRSVFKATKRSAWILGCAVAFLFAALFLTYCRGALLGFGAGLLVLLVVLKNVKLWVGAGLVVVCLGIYGYQSDSRYFKNFSLNEGFQLRNDDKRLLQWKAAALTFIENPLAGIGHRQFERRSVELKKQYGFETNSEGYHFEGHAHNNFLEAFASNGVFGGVAFFAFCGYWWAEVLRSQRGRVYFLPAVTAFIVSGFFENTFTDSEVLHTILLIYSVSQMALLLENSEAKVAESEALDSARNSNSLPQV